MHDAPPADEHTRARCVLWHDATNDDAAALAETLESRGVRVSHAANGYAALAQLCRMARAGDHRSPLSLVLVEPMGLHDGRGVVRAAQNYAGRCVIWQYESAGTPQLRAVADDDVNRWPAHFHDPEAGGALAGELKPTPPLSYAGTDNPARIGPAHARTPDPTPIARTPQLRLTNDDEVEHAPQPPDDKKGPLLTGLSDESDQDEETPQARQLLTPAELTMLLSDDPPAETGPR